MIDSFPFDKWGENITAFWTFGPENSTGTYILTALGVIVMIASLVGWVMLEQHKLQAQAALLRAAGGLPMPGGAYPGPGPSQPPMAGPSTDPGT
jgi:hypothetical protein